ncbi:hypothetical protein CLF_109926 [Clonorchis sinensis]|uniref:Uncharacterized protein n=1 Tax=Clonorchis sinensis TaxID=79923 RepID=G7YJZ1_CLOSI|nr:hypothetical protein CLF_109926 [Clonorchis sinensis]
MCTAETSRGAEEQWLKKLVLMVIGYSAFKTPVPLTSDLLHYIRSFLAHLSGLFEIEKIWVPGTNVLKLEYNQEVKHLTINIIYITRICCTVVLTIAFPFAGEQIELICNRTHQQYISKCEHVRLFRRENSDASNVRWWSSVNTLASHVRCPNPGTATGYALLMSSNKSETRVQCFPLEDDRSNESGVNMNKESGADQDAPAVSSRIRNETVMPYSLRPRVRPTLCNRAVLRCIIWFTDYIIQGRSNHVTWQLSHRVRCEVCTQRDREVRTHKQQKTRDFHTMHATHDSLLTASGKPPAFTKASLGGRIVKLFIQYIRCVHIEST